MRCFPVVSLALGLLFCAAAVQARTSSDLEFQMFTGVEASLFPNSVLILGKRDAVLIDGQWWLSEGRKLADMIERSGRRLKAILVTHAHPDHYMGLTPIVERFPGVRVLARKPVREEIQYGFPGKLLHWQELVPDDMPAHAVVPEDLRGNSIDLEGHEIRFIDLPPAETVYATAFYVPSARALIAGDLIFAGTHTYMADLSDATVWIKALEFAKKAGPIEKVYPGHGHLGGPELIDQQVEYLQSYNQVATPGKRVREIAPEMTRRYPDHRGAILLWLTRGPGFGLSGAREFGVPPGLLPPELLAPSPATQ
ncbi:MAG: MBL fold metallo-hydrolase [Gammaproteobacteria bacterium]|nr:MBL fold metallo-hydrolase [Gammaproteobacteria bacterium]